mmetsp:Transcript_21570/g.61298  ORF Transcript_21570/g.61298 Transcript_21570/m.61298 type:complete len:379 (+) Transcript_21570:825-1961(+)
MESDAADPVGVALATEDQLAVGHRPHLPRVVVAGCGNDGDLRVEGYPRDWAQMALEGLHLLHLRHRNGIEIRVSVRVAAVLGRPGRLLLPLGGLALGAPRGLFVVLVGSLLVELLLQRLCLAHESIALKSHQHLLLHCHLVLVPKLRERGLVLLIMLFQPLQVNDELVLLLHHATVVHPVEVALLAELVPRVLGGRGHRPRLLHLLAQHGHLFEEASVLHEAVGHAGHRTVPQPPVLLQLVPLRLKHLQGALHAVLDQEVADEVVDHLRPLLHLGEVPVGHAGLDLLAGLRLREEPVDVVERLVVVVQQFRVLWKLLVGKLLIALVADLNLLEDRVPLLPAARGGPPARHGHGRRGRPAVSLGRGGGAGLLAPLGLDT